MNRPADPERQVDPPEALRRLQEEFGRATRTPLSFATGHMRCLPDAYPAGATDAVRSRGRQTPRERLAVYNEQYWFRLLTVLQDHFPLLARTLGYWEFNQLATEYLHAHPSRRPFLEDLAWNLPAFLRSVPRFGNARNLQIAAVDAAALRAFHAPALASFNPLALSMAEAASLADMPLEFQPGISFLEENWNLAENRRAVLEHPGYVPRFAEGKGRWAVYRRDGVVEWRALELAAFLLLRALQAGGTLGAACESVGASLEGGDIEGFMQNLAPWFAEWTALGWFAIPLPGGGVRKAEHAPSTWNRAQA